MRASIIASLAALATLSATSVAAPGGVAKYLISLGNGYEPIGFADGGASIAMIASATNANGWMARRNSGVQIVKDFTVHFYAHDSPTFLGNGGVLQAQFANANQPISGSVFEADKVGDANNINFTGGYLGNIVFPALNASNTTGSSFLSVDIQPLTATIVNNGIPPQSGSDKVGWSVSHYAVSVDGANASGATNVSSISINTNEFINSFFGQTHDPQDLILTIPDSQLGTSTTGFTGWLNEPNAGAQDLRNGSVTFFDTLGSPIGTLGLHGLIIRGIVPTTIANRPGSTMNVVMTVSSADWTHA